MVILQQEEHYQLSYVDVFKFNMLKRYATFSGRASRSEYWRFMLVLSMITVINTLIEEFVSAICGEKSTAAYVVSGIAIIINLAFVLPQLAVTSRRLHDIGKSGWNQLLMFIPIIGWLIVLAFTVRRSDSGANVYGPEPQRIVITPAMAKQIDKEATPSGKEDIILASVYIIVSLGYWIYIMAFAIGGGMIAKG